MASQPLRRLLGAMVLLASSPLLHAEQAATAETAVGDLWQMTSQMSVEGMDFKMAPTTSETCAPRTWTQPPGTRQEEDCQNSDFRMEDNKATWKITCTDEAHTTGEGEIIRDGDDAFTGTIKFTSDEGNMNLAISGVRSGDCDNPIE